ncbi:PH domain containing protein [Acanthamoeba castellanii str. Neff]|uniref:PH domain containing protein n=1 Tax=Acanthamoeba castellanii (strain ATCC 30010 / Neff) TaxID=1257118 RepID=L8GLK2_ACACF|nr:PH domain containing protein [Acanthamoeba castellanii str. Neff]ELR13955.1 PH domain containing protein [Acanthamoeba castellanii str. Neff]
MRRTTIAVHQGWLKKKGKKRWFILQANSLYWFAKEQKAVTFQHSSVKGCLELKGYAVSVSEKKSHTFIVSNLRDMNYYELTATTDESMNQWVEHIRASIQQATDNEALGRSGDQPLEGKRGVLIKKGQERLFVLKVDSLMWFLSKTGAEKKAKGSLPLKDITLKRGTKGYSFVLQPKVGKAYTLFGATQLECDEWMEAISRAIERLNFNQTTVKNGWLEKKGQKRYFVIKNGKLLWFNKMQKDDDAEANGYLLLDTCKVSILPPANGKYSLHIVASESGAAAGKEGGGAGAGAGAKDKSKREYTLTATSETECSDWAVAMVNAGATGDMPSRAASSSRRSVMAAPSSTDPVVRRPVSGIQLSDGVFVSRPASSGGSGSGGGGGMEGFMVAEKSGWLEKKGKRRWFVLTAGEFAWYDQPRQHQKGEKPNGSILAKDASVAQIGEIGNGYFVFAIYSATARESEYLLQASSLTEMEDWVVALVLAGANPGKDRATSVCEEGSPYSARPDILPENDKNGWMEKKGRKRWFVLRNSHLYWYKAVQETEAGLKEATGSLELEKCTVKKLDGKLKGRSALVISSSAKGEYLLLHEDEAEIDSWVRLLIDKGGASKYRAAVASGGPASGMCNYFGISLQQLLAKEKGDAAGGIPILVRKCAEHIRAHGMEAEGIFRVSGEQIDIVALKQEFESASDPSTITFADNIDVHAVSGLMKMFFRELNPPLMTFDLYSDFMAAAGCVMSDIKALIAQLPAENKILLGYLLHFLYDVSQLGDLNKMRPMNLAIVFSPNLFRSNRSAFEFMIANAHELMPAIDSAADDVTAPPALPALPAGLASKPLPGLGARGSPAAQLSPLLPPSSAGAASRVLPPAVVASAPQFGSTLSPRVLPAPPQPLPIGGPMLQSPALQAKVSAEILQRISAGPAQ